MSRSRRIPHTRHKAPAAGSATPVFDLLFLLTIAFLGVGVFQAATLRNDVGVPTLKEHASEARELANRGALHFEALRPLRDRLQRQLEILRSGNTPVAVPKVDPADIDRARQEVAAMKARAMTAQAAVDNVSAEAASLTSDTQVIPQELIDWLDELEKLEERRQNLQSRLAALEAAAARAQGAQPKLTGARVVRTDYEPEVEKLIMVTHGRVYAYPENFNVTQEFFMATARPSGEGLSIKDAVAPSSALMKEVTSARYRRAGRASILVRPDSFATFRLLRDSLVDKKIDYGWLPWAADLVTFGSGGGGQRVYSHGGR